MKKSIIILSSISLIFIAWCGSSNHINKEVKEKLDTNKPLINVNKELEKSKKVLEKSWLTGEKLQKAIKLQKEGLKVIANLKWGARKKYILENKVLPEIIKDGKVNPKCKATNLDNYVSCLYTTKTPIEKLLKQIPKELHNIVKKTYYHQIYTENKQELFKATKDKIAIQEKKETLSDLKTMWVLSDPSVCNRFPEQEVKDYCKNLFKR